MLLIVFLCFSFAHCSQYHKAGSLISYVKHVDEKVDNLNKTMVKQIQLVLQVVRGEMHDEIDRISKKLQGFDRLSKTMVEQFQRLKGEIHGEIEVISKKVVGSSKKLQDYDRLSKTMVEQFQQLKGEIHGEIEAISKKVAGSRSPPSGIWKLQQTNVCFGAKNKDFGRFEVRNNGRLTAIQLVYRSGYTSNGRGKRSKWGDGKGISMYITDQFNRVVLPKTHERALRRPSRGWYLLPGYDSNSRELLLTDYASPAYYTAGTELRVWYGEDLTDQDSWDNSGHLCADVYGMFV